MSEYGIFRKDDAKRIARATRRVEGTPGTFIKVPERVSRTQSPGNRRTLTTSGFTISEYEPSTGEVLGYMDRGRRRYSHSSTQVTDIGIFYSSDGFLYALGNGYIAKDNGSLIKWNPNTCQAVWYSDQGAYRSPGTQLLSNGTVSSVLHIGGSQKLVQTICESSDGYIWTTGVTVDSVGSSIGRTAKYDPDTGAQLLEVTMAGGSGDFIYASDNSGGVIVGDGPTSGFIRALDSSGASTALFNTISPSVVEVSNGVIVTTDGSTLKTLNLDDLTEISSRSVPAGETYISATTDGTTVWVATSHATTPKYRSYSASDLATENWNANRDTGSSSSIHLKYVYSALYCFSQHVRKIDATSGTEIWDFAGGATAPTYRTGCAVSSSLVFSSSSATGANFYAIDDSSGEAVWADSMYENTVSSVLYTPDGRLFVCGRRTEL